MVLVFRQFEDVILGLADSGGKENMKYPSCLGKLSPAPRGISLLCSSGRPQCFSPTVREENKNQLFLSLCFSASILQRFVKHSKYYNFFF